MSSGNRSIPSPSPSHHASDSAAQAEVVSFAEGTLQEKEDISQHGRREKILDHIGRFGGLFVWFCGLLALAFIVAWAWNLLAPNGHRWLSSDEVSYIQEKIITVVFGFVLGFLVKNKFISSR